MSEYASDIVIATADLVARSGAHDFEIGYLHDDVPIEEAAWWAAARYQGARLQADDHRSPEAAALALATRLLDGAGCRCGKMVSLNDDDEKHCRWRLMGDKWEPGCDAPSMTMSGERGDVEAMTEKWEQERKTDG